MLSIVVDQRHARGKERREYKESTRQTCLATRSRPKFRARPHLSCRVEAEAEQEAEWIHLPAPRNNLEQGRGRGGATKPPLASRMLRSSPS